MKIKLPEEKYYELAIKNINLMDYTANPYLTYSSYSKTVELDLDRVPFIYAKEIIEYSIIFFKNMITKIEESLLNTSLNKYEIEKLNVDKKDYEKYIDSINLYQAYREGSIKQTPKTLRQMSYALQNFLDNELPKYENNWVYYYDKELNYYQPILITSIGFQEKADRNSYDRIYLTYEYIKNNQRESKNKEILYDDMKKSKRTPKELLMNIGFFLEEEVWLKVYNDTTADFYKKSIMQNIEFIDERGTRYINDNLNNLSSLKATYENTRVSFFGDENKFHKIPIIPRIYCYDLNEYSFKYVDTRVIEPYIYDADVEKKLILPTDHKNLIDILLSEEYQSHDADFIKGKGNGTLILAMGKAGLGKTLTSEVYAERKKIARLKIHASQLGTDETKIEKKLKEFMQLAERWKCILLIDEADVYIRKRDNDVQHNAIVATMLQQIEYFNGILFMTTNRTEDVDEAILSRCSAILKYTLPSAEMSRNLWEIFIEQNHLSGKITDDVLDKIINSFEKLSGRDIRNIISLVSKYCLGNKIEQIDFEIFKLCATFRGIYSIGDKENKEKK